MKESEKGHIIGWLMDMRNEARVAGTKNNLAFTQGYMHGQVDLINKLINKLKFEH